MHFVYIIFSSSYDKFYVGETHDLESRLNKHNAKYYENQFTSFTDDWEYFWRQSCESKSLALKIEGHIKKMKSRKYLFNIKKYPEMFEKLVLKYSS